MNAPAKRHEMCRHLRSKEMLIETPESLPAQAGCGELYWCTHSMNCLGPDGQLVSDAKCAQGRACFESLAPKRRPIA